MKNAFIQYEVISTSKETDEEIRTPYQAYIKAETHEEALKKLAKFLGKNTEFKETAFSDANAEVIE